MMSAPRMTSMHPDAETLGDWNAPEGSELWCRALRLSMQSKIKSLRLEPEAFRKHVERAIRYRAWSFWKDASGKTFRTFDDFCEAPQPYGLGRPYPEIRPILEAVGGPVLVAVETAPALASDGGPREGAGRPNKNQSDDRQTDNRTTPRVKATVGKKGGNSRDYLAARIIRDAPEIQARMLAGEFKSVRAAAIEAGLVKPPDPVKVAARALRKVPSDRLHEVQSVDLKSAKAFIRRLTPEEQSDLYEWLGKELGR